MTAALVLAGVTLFGTAVPSAAQYLGGPEKAYGPWAEATNIDDVPGNHPDLNSPSQDGCPIQSPDGLSFYFASTRPVVEGVAKTDLDIWVATRSSTQDGWGAPVNLGAPVNTSADDFCPTPVGEHGLFFVSRRAIEGVTCGLGDIFFTTRLGNGIWRDPRHLGCGPDGPNSALDEQGPSYLSARGVKQLYFSRSASPAQDGGPVAGDIFVADQVGSGTSFGEAVRVSGDVNTATGNEIQPSLRRDGLEMIFSTNFAHPDHAGAQDLYVVTRASLDDDWSAPLNLGRNVNTAGAESRPALSRDGSQLLFGRTPGVEGTGSPIPSDVFVSNRTVSGH